MSKPEPHLILLPGEGQFCECSVCGQLFLPKPLTNTARLADEFIDHVKRMHGLEHDFPLGVSVRLANVPD